LRTDPESRSRWITFIGLALAVIVIDQLTKLWVDSSFQLAATHPVPGTEAPTPLIGEFVRIAKSYNAGGIFGLFGNSALVLAVASLVVIGLIVLYEAREGTRSWWLTIALALLLGGAVGNFIDRIRIGWVIDFVDMGIGDARFYTFNVADSAISIALLLLIVLAVFRDRLTRPVRPTPPAAQDA
jgi:signal peptidase II